METVCIGENENGVRCYIDKEAFGADGIIINNRIKPHTAFRGDYESGIMKMMAIGLGKQFGADVCHDAGFRNMAENIFLFGKTVLEKAKILFAVATIENAYDETAKLVVINAPDIINQEPGYLMEAKANMPRILVDSCDLLIVDRMGKDISGDGMDPNITGRFGTPYASGGIRAQRVAVLDLTDATHGNALGIGSIDVTTQRAIEKIELSQMYLNAMTSRVLGGVSIPVVMKNDLEVIQMCIKSSSEVDHTNLRIVRIPDTLHLEEIMLSEAYWEEIKTIEGITIISEPAQMCFDENQNLNSFKYI
jgi:hypothetical protein